MWGTSSPEHTQWLAVQVWAGREQLTARHLLARHYEVFLPSYREWHQWSDRRKAVDHALFTGYLFCREVPDVVAKIVSTPGVIRVVDDGSRPIPVDLHEIETLKRVITAGVTARPCEFLEDGDRVDIIDGPLRGSQALFVRVKDHGRLIISISLLKRSISVEIDASWVRVSPHASRHGNGYSTQVFDGAGHGDGSIGLSR